MQHDRGNVGEAVRWQRRWRVKERESLMDAPLLCEGTILLSLVAVDLLRAL